MHRSIRTTVVVCAAALAATACAVNLGGPSAENYDTVVFAAPPGASAAEVGAAIREAGAEIAMVTASQDSTWLAEVATNARLQLSGPGTTSGRSLAFMTNIELLGDTALVLGVDGGGYVHMHDALYQIDEYRNLDLMTVRLDAPDVRAAARTLLSYIATDVGADVALIIALEAATPAAADSASVLMRATVSDAELCEGDITGAPQTVRLLYHPSARIECLSARPLASPAGIVARLQVR